jgi:hypothetical protein
MEPEGSLSWAQEPAMTLSWARSTQPVAFLEDQFWYSATYFVIQQLL